jgi:hypothetical protein
MEEKSPFQIMMDAHDEEETKLEKIKFFFKVRWWRIKDKYYNVKQFMQKVFRKNHIPDIEIWNLYSFMAPYILKRLEAFKAAKRVGYPSHFSEYNEHEWSSREEYDEAVRKGDMLGGGKQVWEDYLDKMIFAFDYIVYYDSYDNREYFLNKYNLEDPHAKKLKNRKESYVYELEDGSTMMTEQSPEEIDRKYKKYLGKGASYLNVELEREIAERMQEGFELFGKFFTNLWD